MQESPKLSIKQVLQIPSLNFSKKKRFSNISYCHGPFVIFDNIEKAFDLRPYNLNPIFGHNHPVFTKLYDFKSLKGLEKSLNQKELNFFDKVYKSNKRLIKILSALKEYFSLRTDLPIIELDHVTDSSIFFKNGLFLCDNNFNDDKATLYINLALDDELLNDLIERIKKCL